MGYGMSILLAFRLNLFDGGDDGFTDNIGVLSAAFHKYGNTSGWRTRLEREEDYWGLVTLQVKFSA